MEDIKVCFREDQTEELNPLLRGDVTVLQVFAWLPEDASDKDLAMQLTSAEFVDDQWRGTARICGNMGEVVAARFNEPGVVATIILLALRKRAIDNAPVFTINYTNNVSVGISDSYREELAAKGYNIW